MGKKRKTKQYNTDGNSLLYWTDVKNPLKVCFNYFIILIARHLPSMRLKNILYSIIGIKQGEGVTWGLEATPDIFFPELIEIGDEVIIGYDATILCHEFLQNRWRKGSVEIEDSVTIGAQTIVLPGVKIGEEAIISANSLVNRDVKPGEKVGGVPIKNIE